MKLGQNHPFSLPVDLSIFIFSVKTFCIANMGCSGGAMVLGQLSVPGRPTIRMIIRQGPIVLAVGACGGCLDIFTFFYLFSPLSSCLWEMAQC